MHSSLLPIFNRPLSKIENFDKRLQEASEGVTMAMLLNCCDLYKGETFNELYAHFFSGEYMKLLGVTDVDMSFEHLMSEPQGEFMMQAFNHYRQSESFVLKRNFSGMTSNRQHLGRWTRTLYSIKDGASSTMNPQKIESIDLFDEKLMKLILKHWLASKNAVDAVYKSTIANAIEEHTRSRLPIFNQSILGGYLDFFSKKRGHANENLIVSLIRVNSVDLNTLALFIMDLLHEELPRGACILSTDSPTNPLEFLLLSPDICAPNKTDMGNTTLNNEALFPKSYTSGTMVISKEHYRVQLIHPFLPRMYVTRARYGSVQPGLSEREQRLLILERIKEKFGLKKAA